MIYEFNGTSALALNENGSRRRDGFRKEDRNDGNTVFADRDNRRARSGNGRISAIYPDLPRSDGRIGGGFDRDERRGAAIRGEDEAIHRRRRADRARRRKAEQRFALILAIVAVAIPLFLFMPWSGGTANADAPTISAALPTATLEAHVERDTFPLQPTEDKPAYIPDAAEVGALAKMLYGEARGVPSDTEKAACAWCVLNRVDDPRFPDTVIAVLEAPYQFAGYSADYPVTAELAQLAADVLTRYHAEKDGDAAAGRVLPPEYCFFTGDGEHNYFTIEWQGSESWGWTLESPYAS